MQFDVLNVRGQRADLIAVPALGCTLRFLYVLHPGVGFHLLDQHWQQQVMGAGAGGSTGHAVTDCRDAPVIPCMLRSYADSISAAFAFASRSFAHSS